MDVELGALNALHISAWDNAGGAGRSAYRLHTGLRRRGIRSRMLVGWKVTGDKDVRLIRGRWLGRLDHLCGRLFDRLSLQYLFYPSSFLLPWRSWFRKADIIQLYITHGGYFSHTALTRISRLRPVVWRLSDMWSMTGHCAYSYECERWKSGCGACPYLADYPGLRRDTTALLWQIKDWIYARSRLTIVAPSKWAARLVEQSPLFNRFPVHIIPNGLDTEVFRPLPKCSTREMFDIDTRSRVIFFSAHSVSDRRKGAPFLEEALSRLADGGMKDVTVLVVGARANEWELGGQLPVKCLGEISDDQIMAAAYATADLFILPTLAENLPNGILESMACGTPVVSFNVGGVPEAVRHMETGYLAAYRDAADLAKGIQLLLDDPDLRSRMSRRCREIVEQEYSMDLQAKRFIDLYHDVIDRHRRSREEKQWR